jgi:hypothetical protein
MQDSPRFTISRHLIILMPRQPVLDWIKRVDPEPPNISLDELRQDQNAFLVPETLDGQEDAERWIQRRWAMFFESYLTEWYTEKSWWPQKRTFKMFKEWFEIQYHSMVWDMAPDEPMDREEWESLEDDV